MASSSSWSFLSIAKRGARSCWMDLGSHGTASAMGQRAYGRWELYENRCVKLPDLHMEMKNMQGKREERNFLLLWIDADTFDPKSQKQKSIWSHELTCTCTLTYPFGINTEYERQFALTLGPPSFSCSGLWPAKGNDQLHEGTSINHGSNVSYRTCLASRSSASLPALTLFQTHHDLTINSGSQHACHDNRNREKSLMMIRCTLCNK